MRAPNLQLNQRIFFDLPDPTPADLEDPVFNAIYEATKDWDVGAPKHHSGHTGMTGNHVMVILNAVRELRRKQLDFYRGAHYQRMDPQPVQVGASHPYLADGTVIPVPADMPGAVPWRDRDGEWYWRHEIR
jgi:hypothetical protein